LNEAGPASAPPARAPSGRGRAYLLTWLLAFVAFATVSLFDNSRKLAEGNAAFRDVLGGILFSGIVALTALPLRFVLSVVPERSPSSGVRLFRRVLLGILFGLFLAAVFCACLALAHKYQASAGGPVAGVGAIFGLIAGLVDSIAHDARAPDREDDGAGAGG
jgi:hypothetical protein